LKPIEAKLDLLANVCQTFLSSPLRVDAPSQPMTPFGHLNWDKRDLLDAPMMLQNAPPRNWTRSNGAATNFPGLF
jgi:hypothetical protein